MKKALLIPVKDLGMAKSRLSNLLSQSVRTELAEVMLRTVFGVVAKLDWDWLRVIVTNYPPAIDLAASYGFSVIQETHQVSESESVDFASQILEEDGVLGCLRLPLDLPLLDVETLRYLLNLTEKADVVIIPSYDGTGTNALYRSSPTLFPSKFGEDSLEKHSALARKKTDKVIIQSKDRIGVDIDEPEDLALLGSLGMTCPTLDFLIQAGIAKKTSEGSWEIRGKEDV